MTKLKEWKLAQKIEASGRRGIIIGMCVAVLIIAAVIIAIVKIQWIKRNFCACDINDFDDDYYLDDDEDGCMYTSETDFVE